MRLTTALVFLVLCQVCRGDVELKEIQLATEVLPSDHGVYWFIDLKELMAASITPNYFQLLYDVVDETESKAEAEFALATTRISSIVGSLDSLEGSKRAVFILHSDFKRHHLMSYLNLIGFKTIRTTADVEILEMQMDENIFSMAIPIRTPAATIEPVIRIAVVDDATVILELGTDKIDPLITRFKAKSSQNQTPRNFWRTAIKHTIACVATETKDPDRLLDNRNLPDRIAGVVSLENGIEAEFQLDFPTEKRAKALYEQTSLEGSYIDSIWRMLGREDEVANRSLREIFTHMWRKCDGRRVRLGITLPAEAALSADVTYLDANERPVTERQNAKYIVFDSHHSNGLVEWDDRTHLQIERVVACFDQEGKPIERQDGYWKKVSCFASLPEDDEKFTRNMQVSELLFDADGNVTGYEIDCTSKRKSSVNKHTTAEISEILPANHSTKAKEGDRILAVNDVPIRSKLHFDHEHWCQDIGRPLHLKLFNGKESFAIKNDGLILEATTNKDGG